MRETAVLLAQLEDEERAISRRRQKLHERIDFVRASAFGDPGAEARLVHLEAEERELSRERRELHACIDELKPKPAGSSSGVRDAAPSQAPWQPGPNASLASSLIFSSANRSRQ
jgi:hypothetical protein